MARGIVTKAGILMALFVVAAACTADEPTDSATDTARGATTTSEATTTTAGERGGLPYPIGSGSIVTDAVPFDAQPFAEPCGLQRVDPDDTRALEPVEESRRAYPVLPGSVRHDVRRIGVVAEGWLEFDDRRLVRFDPIEGTLAYALELEPGCVGLSVAAFPGGFALATCRSDEAANDEPPRPDTCHVSLVDDETGAPVRGWSTEVDGESAPVMGVLAIDGALVMALGDVIDAPRSIVVFDAESGEGWWHQTVDGCGDLYGTVPFPGAATLVVSSGCYEPGDNRRSYDPISGAPVDNVFEAGLTVTSEVTSIFDGRVWLSGQTWVQAIDDADIESVESRGLEWDDLDQLRWGPFELPSGWGCCWAAVGPDTLWLQVPLEAERYGNVDLFIGRYSLETLELVDSWELDSSLESREPLPAMLNILSVDGGGIWYTSGGNTYRYDIG